MALCWDRGIGRACRLVVYI